MNSNFFRINGLPVAPAVARALLELIADHDKNCPCGVPLRVTSGWRSKQDQHDIFVRRYTKNGRSTMSPPDYRWYQGARWGWTSGPGVVASPDDVSNHTRGYATDLNVSRGGVCQKWMLKNAGRHGFNWDEGRKVGEAWHWCWMISIRPHKGAPDPWDGRGMPNAAPKSDPGMEELYGSTTPPKPAPVPPAAEEEDDDMAMKGAAYKRGSKTIYMLFNEQSGFYVEHSGTDGSYNNPIAQAWGTGSWPSITEAHATVIKRSLDAIRRTAVTGSLSVDMG